MLGTAFFLILQLSYAFGVDCPGGGVYESNFNRCYIYYSQPEVFLAAESTCRSIGEAVGVLSNGNLPSAYWIGANLLVAPKWTWTTNNTATYTNWAADQPQDPSSFDCASVRTDGTNLWKKELCYSARPFMCTALPISTPSVPTPQETPCDPGYTQYADNCFKIFTDFVTPLDYDDSNQFCRFHENASLPKISDIGVQNFLESFIYPTKSNIWLGLIWHVKTLTNGHPPPTYWIGANLLLAPKWTWTTNDTALFTNWAPDEPVDPSNFDCGSVRSDTYLWKKELCYSARPFVCTANPIPDPNECPLPRVKRYFSGDSPCDPGYTQYGNQCFKLFTNFIKKMNFYESSMYCQFHENATLPKITSPGVQNFLESLVFREEGYIWLGLTCIGNDGVRNCEWFDASNPTYTNYSPGEPSQHYPIIMSVSNGLWISEWDFRPLTKVVVCQKPARM